MRKKLSILAGMLLLCFQLAIAQTVDVSGKVTDEKGNPVANASVTERGTNNGTTTDAGGIFKFSVKKNATLEISSIGFETLRLSAGNGGTVNVQLVKSSGTQALFKITIDINTRPAYNFLTINGNTMPVTVTRY